MSTNANVESFFVKDCALVTIATGKKAHKAVPHYFFFLQWPPPGKLLDSRQSRQRAS